MQTDNTCIDLTEVTSCVVDVTCHLHCARWAI